MPTLVDLEIPAASTLIVLHRKDGSTTVSVDADIAEEAVKRFRANCGAIHMPPEALLHQPPERIF